LKGNNCKCGIIMIIIMGFGMSIMFSWGLKACTPIQYIQTRKYRNKLTIKIYNSIKIVEYSNLKLINEEFSSISLIAKIVPVINYSSTEIFDSTWMMGMGLNYFNCMSDLYSLCVVRNSRKCQVMYVDQSNHLTIDIRVSIGHDSTTWKGI